MNTDNIEVTQQEEEAFNAMSEKVEWESGDKCVSSTGYQFTFVGLCNYSEFDCILMSEKGVPTFGFTKELSKPETEAEKLERERLENGSRYTLLHQTEEAINHGIFRLWEMEDKETRNHYCQLAEIIGHKTNYRKESK